MAWPRAFARQSLCQVNEKKKRKKGERRGMARKRAVQRKILILIFYFGQNNIVSLYVNRV